jgi:protein-arginine kinase activator protein McsA
MTCHVCRKAEATEQVKVREVVHADGRRTETYWYMCDECKKRKEERGGDNKVD